MTEQIDWIGDKPPRRRQPRESHSELRDVLASALGRIPDSIRSGGSAQHVREWKKAHAKAEKVLHSARSSAFELEQNIKAMELFR